MHDESASFLEPFHYFSQMLAMACFTYGSLAEQCIVPPSCFRHLFRHVANGDLDPTKDLSRLMGPIVSEALEDGDRTLSNYIGCWWAEDKFSRYSMEDIIKMWEGSEEVPLPTHSSNPFHVRCACPAFRRSPQRCLEPPKTRT